MLAETYVLWRLGHNTFALTGWGWIALLIVLGTIEEFARRRR